MGRSPCCDKNGLKKGPWTQEEDSKLMQYIQTNGPGNWRTLPKNAGLQRCGKSCRLRWTNYLRPDIKRGRFSFEEEETIIQLHSVLGNKWSAIAARLPGRTDNEIKNYWNTHIRKRLLRTGIDPVTHNPRLDFLDLPSILSSSPLNLSNLLCLQTMVNPVMLRLASLLSSGHGNPNLLLQRLQENQIFNGELQNQYPTIQTPIHEVPSCILNQTQLMDGNSGQFPTDSAFRNFQENHISSSLDTSGPTNYGYCMADEIRTNASENSATQVMNNSQNFQFDSVLATPLSSSIPTPLSSSSTYINSGSTEDERESFCSNILRFEIPESLNFDDFM